MIYIFKSERKAVIVGSKVSMWCHKSWFLADSCRSTPNSPIITMENVDRRNKGCKQLTSDDRKAIYYMVKACCNNDKVNSGSFPKIAAHFGVRPKTVAKVWRQTKLKVAAFRSQHPGHGDALPPSLFRTGRSNALR